MPPKKLESVPHYSNKTTKGFTETQVLAQDAKRKKTAKKVRKIFDMFGNKIFDTEGPASAFEK